MRQVGIVVAVLLFATQFAFAQGEKKKAPTPVAAPAPAPTPHVMVNNKDIKWVDGPPALPPGGKIFVLSGDPAGTGPFTLRAKLPNVFSQARASVPSVAHVSGMDRYCTAAGPSSKGCATEALE